MKLAVLKERHPGETRVAVSPDTVKKLIELGFSLCIEKNAGLAASFSDESYRAAGATISHVPLEIISDADIVLKVQPTPQDEELNELKLMKKGAVLIGLLSPYENKTLIRQYADHQISSFAMEFVPRITRAQTMDVLSSQSNLSGYKAVIEAANEFDRIFPMMMTAAGTITPAKVLVLGAGVAGLQAIATARRLGAVVSAFDVRSSAKEQVESLGANFIEVKSDDANLETIGGYAKEASPEYKAKQQELIKDALKKHDIIICTALIPGKKAPVLIDQAMLELVKPGSVIVDLAAGHGGNCAASKADEIVLYNGVKIIGYSNMPSRLAGDASSLYAKNLLSFLGLLYNSGQGQLVINLEDEIIANTLITHEGTIVNNAIKEVLSHE